LKDGVLTLAVSFDFHKDRIECPKSKKAISKVFEKVFGEPVKLECIVDNNVRDSKDITETVILNEMGDIQSGVEIISSTNPNIIDSVTEVFGDELVNL
jgi:hypothetical protein